MTDRYENILFIGASGKGKSVLDAQYKQHGFLFVGGTVHRDGPADFAEAQRDAHDIEACLPIFHDTVLVATGKSLSDAKLRELLSALPVKIRELVEKWGLADTEVCVQIYSHLRAPDH